MKMKTLKLAIGAAAVLLALSGATALAQERHEGFNDRDQQAARDWYNQHRDRPPVGFRNEDRLSADEEASFREGVVLDRHLRRKMHSAPHDLVRQLPPPEHGHRYVVIGGHVGLIDNRNHVKAVIHLHD
jgi:Ni/Co efflux regulator RcnB